MRQSVINWYREFPLEQEVRHTECLSQGISPPGSHLTVTHHSCILAHCNPEPFSQPQHALYMFGPGPDCHKLVQLLWLEWSHTSLQQLESWPRVLPRWILRIWYYQANAQHQQEIPSAKQDKCKCKGGIGALREPSIMKGKAQKHVWCGTPMHPCLCMWKVGVWRGVRGRSAKAVSQGVLTPLRGAGKCHKQEQRKAGSSPALSHTRHCLPWAWSGTGAALTSPVPAATAELGWAHPIPCECSALAWFFSAWLCPDHEQGSWTAPRSDFLKQNTGADAVNSSN